VAHSNRNELSRNFVLLSTANLCRATAQYQSSRSSAVVIAAFDRFPIAQQYSRASLRQPRSRRFTTLKLSGRQTPRKGRLGNSGDANRATVHGVGGTCSHFFAKAKQTGGADGNMTLSIQLSSSATNLGYPTHRCWFCKNRVANCDSHPSGPKCSSAIIGVTTERRKSPRYHHGRA